MSLVIGRNQVDVKRTTVQATVPENDVAKLMYYLNCVCTAINCDQDEDIRRFTNYTQWARLSIEERKLLLVLCYKFSPDVFESRVFFHDEDCSVQFSNEFYEINQRSHRIIAAESIIIAGRAHRVTKVMFYQMRWMQNCYLEPMQRLARQLAPRPQRPQITRPTPAPNKKSTSCTIL